MQGNSVAAVKVSVFIATSLDGFIARRNGDIDWLSGSTSAEANEDYGYTAFMETVDVLVMGRHTYEKVLTFDTWPYGSKPVVVLSHQQVAMPRHLVASVEALAGTPGEVVRCLAARGARHLYVDGGKTIQGFLEAACVQQLIITRVPILLGSGLPLFGPLMREIRLRHLATRSYATGLVQSTYEVPDVSDASGQGAATRPPEETAG